MRLKILMLRRDVTTLARPACVAAAPEQSPLGSLKVVFTPCLSVPMRACSHARAQTVPELQQLCAQAGVSKTGKKQDLVDKLAQHGGVGVDGGSGGGARAVVSCT